ncbi:MAG: hypothetical protein ABI718_03195 [Acidobacteriota bacterium]
MRSKRSEQGEGQLGCILGLIILAAAVYVAFKLVPVKMDAADMRRTITDQARSAGMMTDERIRKTIMVRAMDLDVPLDEKNLIIRRSNNEISIEASYTVPVKFPGYVFYWKFNPSAENPIF